MLILQSLRWISFSDCNVYEIKSISCLVLCFLCSWKPTDSHPRKIEIIIISIIYHPKKCQLVPFVTICSALTNVFTFGLCDMISVHSFLRSMFSFGLCMCLQSEANSFEWNNNNKVFYQCIDRRRVYAFTLGNSRIFIFIVLTKK